MRIRNTAIFVLVAFCICLAVGTVSARQEGSRSNPAAVRSDLFCTGFISDQKLQLDIQVVGGEKENEKDSFSQGDYVYLNGGREAGITPGSSYYVVRCMGDFVHPFNQKKMGFFYKEAGLVRVVDVQQKTAVAEITLSRDSIMPGDGLRPFQEMVSPHTRDGRPLPRFSEGSGGIQGRIILSRDGHEYLSSRQVVFIDLGSQQGVKPGDFFTVFRAPGKTEGPVTYNDDDLSLKRDRGFSSDRYPAGGYSNVAAAEPVEKVRKKRPELPHKVVGELIVLRVENNTAIAMVTRTLQEINIGDSIEAAN